MSTENSKNSKPINEPANPETPDQPSALHMNAPDHPDVVGDSPEAISRRKFLSNASIALGALSGVAIGVPVLAFILGPAFQETKKQWVKTDPPKTSNDIKVGETIQITFADTSPLPWAGVLARTSAWLRRTSDQQFIAYAVNCTHLGCPVTWIASAGLFLCPCHGGAYYSDGKVAAGPPPKPLTTFPARIGQDGVIEVNYTGIPITS